MNRDTLLALAERCALAAGWDIALDEAVAVAIGWQRPMLPGVCGPNYEGRNRYEWHDEQQQPRGFYPPQFTGSLDAAATLADGWFRLCAAEAGKWEALGKTGPWRKAATPALALTAASLNALARTQESTPC